MPQEEFIISVFCFVADNLKACVPEGGLRKRGFAPKLSDEEVITMEIVGEFWGMDKDKAIWRYFKTHWSQWFPKLGSRTTFIRQAANLWAIKLLLQHVLVDILEGRLDDTYLIDGFPVPVCHFRRARTCECFKGEASFGYCATKQQSYYGFKGHIVTTFNGLITGFTLTQAHADEREAMWEITSNIQGQLLGDKGYLSERQQEELAQERGLQLKTPPRKNMKQNKNTQWSKLMTSVRRRVETVIGQLSEQLNIQKVRARDMWHLSSRLGRKILAHTMGILINREQGNDWLDFDQIMPCTH